MPLPRIALGISLCAIALAALAAAIALPRDDRSEYVHERTGLSFGHDPEFSVYPLEQEEADYLVLRKAPGSRGFYQVAIAPFEGAPSDVTIDLLRERNPGAPMEEKGRVSLAVGEALVVEVGEAPWKTSEIWFARDGFLYQFLADSSLAAELRAMAESARFGQAPVR